jgi:hypothetical protein
VLCGCGVPVCVVDMCVKFSYLENQISLRGATHIGVLLYTSRMHSAWSKKCRGRSTKPKTLISRQIGLKDLIMRWDLQSDFTVCARHHGMEQCS